MKHLDEYRDADQAKQLLSEIGRITTRPWSVMEVCGGQTHAIIRYGIDQLLPSRISLVHGPGCPVCVTPLATIDRAIEIASQPDVILCSFGDMLRVPGSKGDLFQAKAAGADVRVIYSPLDALQVAAAHADRQVVLLAIGFETTAPANALAIQLAQQRRLSNFSALVSHVLVPPAIAAILDSPRCRVDAFLAAGHVCCVTGFEAYHDLSNSRRTPIVVTGFEPLDILEGLRRVVLQLERGEARVENAYPRVVDEAGNAAAQSALADVFEETDQVWRGIGPIPRSGWKLRSKYAELDADRRFPKACASPCEPAACRAGEVLQGLIKPHECEAFGSPCTPRNPLGATMVSSEGACAAYYNYGRLSNQQDSM